METKALIRRRMIKMRDGMDVRERVEKSRRITGRVMGHPAYRDAMCILSYVSYQSEADTLELMKHALETGKRVYCPKVHGGDMEFYRILSLDVLGEGYKGIQEPPALREMLFTGCTEENGKCLMLMPGSAFDRERNRIGYGGGYYDRYLEKHAGFPAMAICFDGQVVEKLPVEDHDRKPDILVTECGIYE